MIKLLIIWYLSLYSKLFSDLFCLYCNCGFFAVTPKVGGDCKINTNIQITLSAYPSLRYSWPSLCSLLALFFYNGFSIHNPPIYMQVGERE